MFEGSRQTGFSIAASDNFRVWPDFGAEPQKRLSILASPTACKKDSCPINLPWKFAEDRSQVIGCFQSEV
jgi:hypothetical protein